MKVALIGLGNMGLPIGINLAKKNVDITGFDVVDERMNVLEKNGGKTATDIQEAADDASIVITMVRTPDQAKSITDDIFKVMDEGNIYVDMSTIGPKAGKEILSKAETKGIEMIDAPVSGGVVGAENGSLTIMGGGKSEIFEQVEEIFEIIGNDIYHVGPAGTGQTAKICLQTLVGAEIVSICESFRLADETGIDLDILYEVLTDSIGTSGMLEVKGERILEGNYEPGADINLQHKDMELVTDAARDLSVPMHLTSTATQEFIHAISEDLGKKDQFSMFELYD
jgi:3-hydroxyisobutyrate dehydrogenase-like beta-hydroxyacid dehydrogenase